MKKIFPKLILAIVFTCCSQTNIQAQMYPASDPSNSGNWIANELLSDEFNDTQLDKTKWWILGENGDYRSKWKGRAPGQFAPLNVRVENGELILSSKWDPSFTFAQEQQDGTYYGGTATAADKSKPITQSCIMSERFFQYGYMEVRCKVADAPVTSAFWTTGYHSEIDMVENYGKRPIGNPNNTNVVLESKYRTNIISWDPIKASNYTEWKYEYITPVRVASQYIVYGFEWDKNYMKTYYNGTLIKTVTRQELVANDQWRHDYPQELWLDKEVFSWYGLPSAADLAVPAEFKVDYVRVWQKEIKGPEFNALGFEGPFYFLGRSSNWFASGTTPPWKMKSNKVASGDFSLQFDSTTLTGTYTYSMFSPYGSLDIPSGANEIKMKVWIDPATTLNSLTVILNNPWIQMTIPLSGVAKGQWVEVTKTFTRNTASVVNISNGDRLQLQVKNTDIVGSNALFYIDDITFKNTNLGLNKVELEQASFKVFPNPAKDFVTLVSPVNGTVTIYNMLGAVIKTLKKTEESQVVSVAGLIKGVYLVSIQSNSKVIATQKLIIE